MCHKGHYSVDKPYLSDNVEEARVFKTVQGCLNSRFKILVVNDEWKEYWADPSSRKYAPKTPVHNNKKLKPGYSIVEIRLIEVAEIVLD